MTINPILPLFVLYLLLAITAGAIIFCVFNKKMRKAKIFRRLAILSLLLIAMLRPGISNGSTKRDLSNLNLFFVIDNTGSMAAKDMDNANKYRFKVAAEDMEKIIRLFPGSKYAIISLDYNVYQAMPLIDSADTAIAYIRALSPRESTSSSDSNLSSLLELTNERIQKYSSRYSDRDNLIFFFSDGENTNNASINTPSDLRQYVVGGAVIGYGTTNGARVGEISFDSTSASYSISESRFIKDYDTGAEHISKLDESNLQSVANSLGIQYYRRANSGDKFNSVSSFTSESAIYHRSSENTNADSDLYWLFASIAIILLFWDFYVILESLLLERKVAK